MEKIFQEIELSKINQQQAEEMDREFTSTEVIEALKQMHLSKAPDLDGFHAGFYKNFWHIVGADVEKMALDCLNNGRDFTELNSTFITLIPKTQEARMVKDYRPISLCNVTYKIMAKMLANRVKAALPSIIDEAQSAFVSRRLITNNSIVAFEAYSWLKCARNIDDEFMTLKLDMSKAYDRVEWSFLGWIL